MNALLSWFEIPVGDIHRAVTFYSRLLGREVSIMDLGVLKMALLNEAGSGGNGALVQHPSYTPSHQGPMVYFNAGADLTDMLQRATDAGAKVLRGKTQISPEFGFMALLEDTEGNRIALHSVG